MRCTPIPLSLTDHEREELMALVDRQETSKSLATRARIVLAADAGKGVRETAADLGVNRQLVQRWRARWRARTEADAAARLSDDPRSGRPPKRKP